METQKLPKTTDTIDKQSHNLLTMKAFLADTSAKEFFKSDAAKLNFYNTMISSLITDQYDAKFEQLYSDEVIKQYHKKAHGHLHKSQKSYNWHLVAKHRIPNEIIVAHCKTRTRKMLVNCAQKMYDMLTSNKARSHDCEPQTNFENTKEYLARCALVATLDKMITAGIIHAKQDK